ncbi:MAG: hypothetical protein QM796_19930 [Chthoniobacteraceae bacterium]
MDLSLFWCSERPDAARTHTTRPAQNNLSPLDFARRDLLVEKRGLPTQAAHHPHELYRISICPKKSALKPASVAVTSPATHAFLPKTNVILSAMQRSGMKSNGSLTVLAQ